MHGEIHLTTDQPFHFADRMLAIVAGQPDGCVVMLSSTEGGCGSYGRLSIDPCNTVEVRFFGWPRVVPGDPLEDTVATEALERIGLRFDGTDWVWVRAYDPRLVPVAAHAAQRSISEAWNLHPGGSGEAFITFRLLDTSEVLSIAAGSLCAWCAGDCTEAMRHDIPDDHDDGSAGWCPSGY